jgi:WD40 repeat protein
MLDRSIRQMTFTADGNQIISTHKDGYQIWNLGDASRGTVLEHDAPGDLMVVSPNGKLMATNVDDSSEVVIWDLKTGKKSSASTAKGKLIGLCFLDDKRLVGASDEGSISTWNMKGGAPKVFKGEWKDATAFGCSRKSEWLGIGTLEGGAFIMKAGGDKAIALGKSDKRIHDVAIAPDGSAFAFGSADENIHIWHEPAPGAPLKIEAHERLVISLEFAPDGRLHSTGGDWWFRIWNAKDGELLDELPGSAGLEAQLMTLSPDGNLMASWSQHGSERGSEAGRWWLWNAKSGALLLEPARHRNAITSVRYSPDGKYLATASEDHSVRLWDFKSTKSLKLLDGAQGSVNDLRFSSDSKDLYSAGVDAVLRKWQWEPNSESVPVDAVGGAVNRFLLSADGNTAYTGDQIGRVWSWDLATGNKIQALDRQGYSAIYDIDLSPDGKYLAIGGSARIVRIIDLNGGQELAQLNPGDTTANFAVRFSKDGKKLATAGDGHEIQIWNTSDWSRSTTLPGHDGTVRCLAFSPDGTRLVSGGNDELVRVWDMEAGKELVSLTGHQDVVSAVDVAPDGKSLASASRDRTALVWKMP